MRTRLSGVLGTILTCILSIRRAGRARVGCLTDRFELGELSGYGLGGRFCFGGGGTCIIFCKASDGSMAYENNQQK